MVIRIMSSDTDGPVGNGQRIGEATHPGPRGGDPVACGAVQSQAEIDYESRGITDTPPAIS